MPHQHPTSNPIRHRFTGGEEEIGKWKSVFKEKFNLGYFYQAFHDFLVEEGFAPRDESEFGEVYYMTRDNPNFGKEARIRWRLEWRPTWQHKDNTLFTYIMFFDWYFLGVKNTEGVYKGQKVEIQKGELELICAAHLLIDKDGKWLDKSTLLKPIKKFLLGRVLKKNVAMHKKALHEACYKCRDWVHNYFKMPPLQPERDEFVARRTLE